MKEDCWNNSSMQLTVLLLQASYIRQPLGNHDFIPVTNFQLHTYLGTVETRYQAPPRDTMIHSLLICFFLLILSPSHSDHLLVGYSLLELFFFLNAMHEVSS